MAKTSSVKNTQQGNLSLSALSGTQSSLKGLVILLIAGLSAYFIAFDNQFTNWDDQGYVYENPLVTGFSTKQIPVIFKTLNIAGNYHPLTILSLGINYLITGPEAWGFILTNVLLHIINAWLIYLIVLKLRQTELVAYGASLMFLLHPLHVESVAWVSERKDVLYTLFWLLAWLQWLNWKESGKTLQYALALAFFILSCLSKGMAITLTGVLLLTDVFLNSDFKKLKTPAFWIKYIPFIIISLIFGYIAILAQKEQGTIVESSAYNGFESFLLVCYGYMFYLIRMFLPWGLAAFYPYPASAGQVFPIEVYLAPLLMALIAFMAWKSLPQNNKFMYAILFYTGCIFIVLQILPVGVAITADRYFYISSIGLCMGFGWLLQWIQQKWHTQFAVGALAGFSLIWGGLTARQANTWQDSLSLFTNVITYHPKASVGYNNIGTILGMERKDQVAIWYYRKAVEYNPRYAEAWNNMGILYKDLGKIDSALFCANRALELFPRYTNALSNLGNIYFSTQQFDLSAEQFRKASEITPNDPGVFLNMGAALQMKGDKQGAENAYLKVLQINPADHRALHNLGDARFNEKDLNGAEQYYKQILAVKPGDEEALRKLKLVEDTRSGKIKDALTTYQDQIQADPKDAKAWLNAGTEYFSQGKYKEAISYFEKALNINPNLPEAWNNLGTSKGITGDTQGAVKCFKKAIALKSNYNEPMYNMGLAYGQMGNQNEAVKAYQQAARLGHAGAQKILKDNGFSW